jgi:hypothetical protein
MLTVCVHPQGRDKEHGGGLLPPAECMMFARQCWRLRLIKAEVAVGLRLFRKACAQ